MKTVAIVLFLLVVCILSTCKGANVLFFFGMSTYSHRITVWPLVEALVDRGHSVTFLQPAENKNPNPKVKEIVPKIDGFDEPNLLTLRIDYGPYFPVYFASQLPHFGEMICKNILDDPEIIKWANASKFDLVIIDALYNDCGLGFAYKWGAQTVIFGTSSVFEWWPDAYGFLPESSWIGNLHNGPLDLPLSFYGRVVSTLSNLYFRYTKVGMLFPAIESIIREKLHIPDMPPLAELESNASLILMNTHYSEEVARSLPPLVVPIGGMHCTEKTKPLPKDMENFINEGGKDGFIYVSFGSGAKISTGPKNLTNIFFNALKNTKTRFIWKWEDPRLIDMPSNVYTAAWMPQQAILAHPHIRAFITHGGLLSIQEALFNAVPMISFPIFAEQNYNAERVHRTKRGIRLEISTLTQKELEDAIKKILTDDTYSNNVKKTSVVFKDRPTKPLDTAVWWVEFVLRHKDTSFLRPLAFTQTWYQRRLLDVWAFLAGVNIAILWIVYLVFRKLLSLCFGKTVKTDSGAVAVSKKKVKVKKN